MYSQYATIFDSSAESAREVDMKSRFIGWLVVSLVIPTVFLAQLDRLWITLRQLRRLRLGETEPSCRHRPSRWPDRSRVQFCRYAPRLASVAPRAEYFASPQKSRKSRGDELIAGWPDTFKLSGNPAKNGEGFSGRGLERQGAASSPHETEFLAR
jgi:hypothetical protein